MSWLARVYKTESSIDAWIDCVSEEDQRRKKAFFRTINLLNDFTFLFLIGMCKDLYSLSAVGAMRRKKLHRNKINEVNFNGVSRVTCRKGRKKKSFHFRINLLVRGQSYIILYNDRLSFIYRKRRDAPK